MDLREAAEMVVKDFYDLPEADRKAVPHELYEAIKVLYGALVPPLSQPSRSDCSAVMRHGAGHQSTSHCDEIGPHLIHRHRRSWAADLVWVGDEGFTDYFDEVKDVPVEYEEADRVLRRAHRET